MIAVVLAVNTKQKITLLIAVPAFLAADWVLGAKHLDAVAYGIGMLVAGVAVYGVLYLLRTKAR